MNQPVSHNVNQQILQDMGIDIWLLRGNDEAASIANIRSETQQPQTHEETAGWGLLRQDVASCTACDLAKSRGQTVFGSGNPNADLMLIGEAPGMEDDRAGEPFTGKVGKLLSAMLFSIGLQREQVYICNVIKCRPPDNRNPKQDEAAVCADFLSQQIKLVSPKVILTLGSFAAHRLLNTDAPIYKMREQDNVLPGKNIPVVVTYHPSSLLRELEQKALSWQDLTKVKHLLKDQIAK